MTAELAAAMPAVILVLAVCLGSLTALGQQAVLGDVAARAARAEGRGDSAATVLDDRSRTVRLTTSREGDLVCVRASQRLALPGLAELITVSGTGCAPADGW